MGDDGGLARHVIVNEPGMPSGRLDRSAWPMFVPLLYIGMFTVMVLLIRPWTFR